MDYFKESLQLHKERKGKIGIANKMELRSKADLSVVYSPSVVQLCLAIAACVLNPSREEIIPSCLDLSVSKRVAAAVVNACQKTNTHIYEPV